MSNSQPDKDESNLSFIIITVIVVLLIAGFWLWAYFSLRDDSYVERGTFGDMFGAVNSLFSGLALAGIILTILLQRKELALQRKELRDTREELKRTASAQENSEKALTRQAENLKITAKLTALSSLVVHYSDLETRIRKGYQSNLNAEDAILRRDRYVQRIEEILERKERH